MAVTHKAKPTSNTKVDLNNALDVRIQKTICKNMFLITVSSLF